MAFPSSLVLLLQHTGLEYRVDEGVIASDVQPELLQ